MNIFVLCGAHDGSLVKRVDEIADTGLYGEGIKWDKIYLFEPQPAHRSSLEALCRKDSRCYLIPSAVSTVDGTATFFVKGELGNCSSTLDPYKHTGRLKEKVEVSTVDFVKWVKDNTNEQDFVVVDMDIECGEYEVLPKLLQSTTTARIKFISIEFHQNKSTYWAADGQDKKIEEQVKEVLGNRFLGHNKYYG